MTKRPSRQAIGDAAAHLAVVDRIYAAALNEEFWPEALEAMRLHLGAEAATIFIQDLTSQRSTMTWTANFDPAWQRLYDEHYCRVNPLMQRSARDLVSGFVAHDLQYIATADFVRTEFYDDYFRRAGVKHIMGLCPWKEDTLTTVISLLRAANAPACSSREVERARALMPHLQRASSIQRRIGQASRGREALEQAVHRAGTAVILLDGRGHVLWCSEAAERALAAADGLASTPAGLAAANANESARLRRLIHDCTQTAVGSESNAGGPLRVSRPSGRRPYAVIVTPLRCASLRDSRDPAVFVFIMDPDAAAVADPDVLMVLHRLTPAEARLASLLLKGASLRDAGEQFGLTINTVKTQLKRLFEKTGTRRQAELVRVLAASDSHAAVQPATSPGAPHPNE